MIKVILSSIPLVIFPLTSFADGAGGGMIGSTSGAAAHSAQGAKENHETAEECHKKAKHWEEEAEAHPEPDGEPNHEMMEHAHHEMRRAREADTQATEFAKDALQALDSRSNQVTSGASQPTMPDGSPIDIAELRRLANMPVNTGPADTGSTGSASFHMNPDNSNTTDTQMGALDSGTVTAQPSGGLASIGGTATGAANGGGKMGGARTLGVPGASYGMNNPSVEGGAGALGNRHSELKAQSTETIDSEHIILPGDGVKDKKTLEANRALIMRQMGLRDPASLEENGPYRAKTEDIFAVVHSHYKNLLDIGMFYDIGQALPPTPGPSRTPPAFSTGN